MTAPGARPPASLGIEGYEDPVLIGEGGFASVYRARQPAFDRLVALKVLSKVRLDHPAMRRFDRERISIGSLSGHPNIVTVYDAGVTDAGLPYLAMEYLPSGSLADRLARGGPLPWQEVARIGVRLAGALESAHQAGILHRDVKPENVLMSTFGEPQLSDFGIARVLASPETRTVDQAVSVAHAPPEVLNGEQFSRRSDVYSLGSTLFTLLWGSPPFLRDDDEVLLSVLVRITTLPPPDLRSRGVPDAMCRVLERALAKRPEDRPQSALELAEELRQVEAAAGVSVTVPFVTGDPKAAGVRAPYPPGAPTHVPAEAVAETVRPPAPAARTRVGARGRWLLVGLPVLLAALTVVTLRGGGEEAGGPGVVRAPDATSSTATTATTTTLAPVVPFPAGTEAVDAGRYLATGFSLPFEFELPEGWRATASGVQDQLELVRVGGATTSALTLMQVSRVFDAQVAASTPRAALDAIRPAPDDLVQWLRDHPRLTTGDAVPVTKGTLSGAALDVQVSVGYANPDCEKARPGRRCVLLFVNAGTVFYSLSEGYRAVFSVLRLGDRTLVAAVEAPAAQLDAFAPEAERVLATLRPGG